MIPACVIDASVAIKWVITEVGSDAANRLRAGGTKFHAPGLIVPETGNILWKKVQRGELSQAEAEAACGILRLAKMELHPMGRQALLALQMAAALDHPVSDMTYLALARTLKMPFITADRRLVNKLAATANQAVPEVVLLS